MNDNIAEKIKFITVGNSPLLDSRYYDIEKMLNEEQYNIIGETVLNLTEDVALDFYEIDKTPTRSPTDKMSSSITGALKDESGKLRLDLVPPELEEIFAKVTQVGLDKGYPERNWEKGLKFMQHVAAFKRHFNDWLKGIDNNDADGGVNHLYHALWHLAAICVMIERGRDDLDDRPGR